VGGRCDSGEGGGKWEWLCESALFHTLFQIQIQIFIVLRVKAYKTKIRQILDKSDFIGWTIKVFGSKLIRHHFGGDSGV